MNYDKNSVYVGKVVEQSLGSGFKDMQQLSLVVKLTGRLRDRFRPKAGVEMIEKDDQAEIRVLFDTENPDRLTKTFDTLERYGFQGYDVNRFDPQHEKCFSLIGKEVYAWPQEKTSKSGAVFYNWYLNAPPDAVKPPKATEIKKIAEVMAAKAAQGDPQF